MQCSDQGCIYSTKKKVIKDTLKEHLSDNLYKKSIIYSYAKKEIENCTDSINSQINYPKTIEGGALLINSSLESD